MEQAAVDEVARMFIRARKTGERLDPLPLHLKPRTFSDAWDVIQAVDRIECDTVVGTKIAARPGAETIFATLHASRTFHSPARVPAALSQKRYMECEISFRLVRDLPPREAAYSEQEVFDALEACAAFEVIDSRFKDPHLMMTSLPHEFTADHIGAGAMVYGTFRHDWQAFDFTKLRVSMTQGSRTIIERVGGHGAGNPAVPAVVLANLRRSSTGMKVGTFIATGSFTGFHPVDPNVPVVCQFEDFGTAEATFLG